LNKKQFVMAGLVPATQRRRLRQDDRGGAVAADPARSARLGGRDKPGHDD
jgi:hypothetical protein